MRRPGFPNQKNEVVARELGLPITSRRSFLVLGHGHFDLLACLVLSFQDLDGALEILD